MISPRRRFVAPLVALAMSGVALHALANPEPDPAPIERYSDTLKRELGLLDALDTIDRDLGRADADLLRLSAEKEEAKQSLAGAESRRADAETKVARMRSAVRSRLRAILRISSLPGLRFIVSKQDFRASVVKDRLLRKLLEADRHRMTDYTQERGHFGALTEARDGLVQRLEETTRKLEDRKQELERERKEKEAVVAKIEDDPRFHDSARKDQEAADAALERRIATMKEWREKQYTFAMNQGHLMSPVNMAKVERGFGPVKHPKFGTLTLHRGLDIRPRRGGANPVRSVFWGRVAFSGWLTGYGDTIILDHTRGWHTVYAHLENVKVKEGDLVKGREVIADVGQSGSLKGRYLYFEIRQNGRAIDPTTWFHR